MRAPSGMAAPLPLARAVQREVVYAVHKLVQTSMSGHMLLDEPYLRSKGVTDFDKYQCVPGHEPPKLDEVAGMIMGAGDKSTASKHK